METATLDMKKGLAKLGRELKAGRHAAARRTFQVLGGEGQNKPETARLLVALLEKAPATLFREHLRALVPMHGIGCVADLVGGLVRMEELADQGESHSILLLALKAVVGKEMDEAVRRRHRERLEPLVRERDQLAKALDTLLIGPGSLMNRLLTEPAPGLTLHRHTAAMEKATIALCDHAEAEAQALKVLRSALILRPDVRVAETVHS